MRTVEGSHRRSVAVVAGVLAGLMFTGAVTAQAQTGWQVPPLGPINQEPSSTTTAPPSTAPPPQETTTTTAAPLVPPADRPAPPPPPPSGQPQPPQAPPPPQQQPPPGEAPPPAEPLPPGEGDGTGTEGRGGMPAHLQAMMNSVRRTPANNTRGLLAALSPLEQYGLDQTQQALVGFGRFPIAGETVWSDDWWFPRFGPGWRLHQGIDMFAAHGTPVRAPVDGHIRVTNGGLGGLSVYVVQPDRTYWYLTHLSGIAEGIAEGVQVKTGQVVGYVGTSGNAAGGKPHLHLQIHPKGGPPVPPKPIIDRFVTDAMALVPQVLEAYAGAAAGAPAEAPAAAAAAAAVIAAAPEPDIVSLTPRAALLWATAANPTGGTLRLVEADAMAAAERIDWSEVVLDAAEREQERANVDLLLAPLVPGPLVDALGMERLAGTLVRAEALPGPRRTFGFGG